MPLFQFLSKLDTLFMTRMSEQRDKQNPLNLISVITEMVESSAELQENRRIDELEEKQIIKSIMHLLILWCNSESKMISTR